MVSAWPEQGTFITGSVEAVAPGPCAKLRRSVVYQPANRFGTFQIIEAALFIGLAAALLAIALRQLRRRST